MIHGERLLEAVDRGAALQFHRAGVVHEHVQRRVAREEVVGEAADSGERREIGEQHVDARIAAALDDRLARALGALAIAADEHHVRAEAGQAASGLEADAGGGSGDEAGASVESRETQASDSSRFP